MITPLFWNIIGGFLAVIGTFEVYQGLKLKAKYNKDYKYQSLYSILMILGWAMLFGIR